MHYSQVFSTAAAFQTSVEVRVLQGERPMAKDNKTIGTFRLKGIKRAPAGVPQIEVTFDIDANGILTVSAKDLDTGKEQSITITDTERMSDDEIEAAMRDAEQYAAQDQVRRDGLAVREEAQRLLGEVEPCARLGRQAAGQGREEGHQERPRPPCASCWRRRETRPRPKTWRPCVRPWNNWNSRAPAPESSPTPDAEAWPRASRRRRRQDANGRRASGPDAAFRSRFKTMVEPYDT